MSDEATARRDHRIKTIGVILIVGLCLTAYPGYWMMEGYQFARMAADNGISVTVSTKLDGFGSGARASQAALNQEVEFNDKLYDEIATGDYLRERYGVEEGLSGFFFGLGTKLGRSS